MVEIVRSIGGPCLRILWRGAPSKHQVDTFVSLYILTLPFVDIDSHISNLHLSSPSCTLPWIPCLFPVNRVAPCSVILECVALDCHVSAAIAITITASSWMAAVFHSEFRSFSLHCCWESPILRPRFPTLLRPPSSRHNTMAHLHTFSNRAMLPMAKLNSFL